LSSGYAEKFIFFGTNGIMGNTKNKNESIEK
jgi:hypothetical protein